MSLAVRAAPIAALAFTIQYLAYFALFDGCTWEHRMCEAAAFVASGIARMSGIEVTCVGALLYTDNVLLNITPSCVGVLDATVVVSLAVACPLAGWGRAVCAICGSVLALVIGQVRIVCLVLCGQVSVMQFDLMHDWVWPAIKVVGLAWIMLVMGVGTQSGHSQSREMLLIDARRKDATVASHGAGCRGRAQMRRHWWQPRECRVRR